MRFVFTILFLFLCIFTYASESAPLTPEQAVGVYRLSDVCLSPDGNRIAFTVTNPPKGAEQNKDIWVLEITSRDVHRFTTSPKSDDTPRWSRNGKTLGFLSNRDEVKRIYLMPADSGEALPLTPEKQEVKTFEWAPDGKRIAFLASDPKSEAEEKKEKEKDDAHVVDRDDKPDRLWIIDATSKEARKVTTGTWGVSELQWMPDGNRLIISASQDPNSLPNSNRIYSIQINDGKMKEVAAPRGPFGNLKISPDGKWIAYIGSRVDGPDPHDLYVQAADGGTPRNLTGASVDRSISSFCWRRDSLLALAETGVHSTLYSVSLDGKARALPDIAITSSQDFATRPTDLISFVGETSIDPPELYLSTHGKAEKVSHFNDTLRNLSLLKPEFFHYKSFDGTDIEAELLKPRDYKAGMKLPLIVHVHGGPTGRWADSYNNWAQLWASRGFAVFYPNVRGSTGYGHRFLEMNRADWGGADFKDLMAGVDYLIQTGLADPNRLGIAGWSYGGYMAEWAITQTPRFKAAISGAGMSNLASEFGTERNDINDYDAWFNGLPYEKQDIYLKSSPIYFMKNAHTPMLILQGEADQTDPIGQSQELYRALKRYGVESEFVVYPREGHSFHEEKHVLDCLHRILDWMDKHMK